jgi:hypothetical protein
MEVAMDRSEVVLIVLLVALVAGMFAFAAWDPVKMPSAEVQTDSALRGASDMERTAVSLGTTLAAKVIAGALVSLLIAVGIILYKQSQINRLKNGGWDRFWERRSLRQRQARTKQPSLTELLTMIVTRDVLKRKD